MLQKNLKPITETKYLSAENAWRYRGIMRQFYLFDQKYKHWVEKEEIFQALKALDALDSGPFTDYTLDQCRQDLDMLVEWGNLSAVQDTKRVASFQQFKNRQFRYQLTEYSIEIERMTIRLENIFVEGGSLEPTLLERLKHQLADLRLMAGETQDHQKAGAWWKQLTADFQRLNQSYQDYIRDWYSIKADELMRSNSFLLYKERLIDYLRHFIKELQTHAFEIETMLKVIPANERDALAEKLTRYELEIPRLEMDQLDSQQLRENIDGKLDSLFGFFVSTQARDSEVETILDLTNEVIRRMARSAASILESATQLSNRKEEYRQIANLFLEQPDLDEAHRLAAAVFGIGGYKHFRGELERETENIQSSILEEIPMVVITPPRVRTYRERMQKTGILERSDEKRRMREQVLKNKAEEKGIIESYLKSGELELSQLSEIQPFVRKAFLRWVAKALQDRTYSGITEFGLSYRITNPHTRERCVLRSQDGNFELPAFRFEFLSEGISSEGSTMDGDQEGGSR